MFIIIYGDKLQKYNEFGAGLNKFRNTTAFSKP